MIIVSIQVESGCSFAEGEYNINLDGAISDCYNLEDHDHICDCIANYEGEIKPEVVYTFFLHRANIATAYPGVERGFDIWQVLENLHDTVIQL